MKLYAQHGALDGDKSLRGAQQNLIEGIIYSPRDLTLDGLRGKLRDVASTCPTTSRLFDPQFYTCFLADEEDARLGYLATDYTAYLGKRRRAQLERESQVRSDLESALNFQRQLAVTAIIAPNVLIPRSFNSIEAVIAKNFIRYAAETWSGLKDPRELYATVAISSQALRERRELFEFLNEITLLEERPAGIYLLVATPTADARYDMFDPYVVGGYMLANHVLALNGFSVINGYSDLLSPFLGAAGGAVGATGWWSNLRSFSLERFEPSAGMARRPRPRYLSMNLLNRITHFELHALRNRLPGVLNGLATDAGYPADSGSLPDAGAEMLQSWEALKTLMQRLATGETTEALAKCKEAVERAGRLYDNITIQLDQKSKDDHLEGLHAGLTQFATLAEIDSTA
ncbi:MAG TPA: hypothetical protein VJA21_09210 [Verrucomicrobiae bacterium]